MWKEYKETFDGVHASQRLKAEVLNMKREENVTKRRRIPAALAAAVLVIVLAGTALAVEIINRAKVDLMDPDESGVSTEGYYLTKDFVPVSLENLSEDARERFASGDAVYIERPEGIDAEYVTWYFDSWKETETFLGLDLGRNTMLEQYPEIITSGFDWTCGCAAGGAVIESEGSKVPVAITLSSEYQIGDYRITVTANLEVDVPGAEEFFGRPLGQLTDAPVYGGAVEGRYTTENEQYTVEEYVTPGGLSAAIVSRSGTQVFTNHSYDLQLSTAYFIKNNASYIMHCKGPDHEKEIALLKMILDAYE